MIAQVKDHWTMVRTEDRSGVSTGRQMLGDGAVCQELPESRLRIAGRQEPEPGRQEPEPGRQEPEPGRITVSRGVSPSAEQLEALRLRSEALEGAAAEEIISWAVETYFPELAMATAFGPEGCLILAMLARIEPRVYVFNLDTGYQFEETHQTRGRIAQQYGIVVDCRRPELTVEQFEAAHGGPLHRMDSSRCCHERKIKVLQEVAGEYQAWMSGIRRDQSPHRAGAPIVGWDAKFGLVKINPLANWTRQDVWRRIIQDKVPYNPLHDRGYPSVGCRPCTRAVCPGKDERAGRWSGEARTECGLHTVD